MKKSKIYSIGAIIAFLVIFAVVTGVVCQLKRNPRVVFYGLSERDRTAVQNVLGDAVDYQTFDTELSFRYQLRKNKKPDVVITTAGAKGRTVADHAANASLSPALLEGITSSVRSALLNGNNTSAVTLPLLSGHFEIDIQTDMLRHTDRATIATWEDIEAFARAAQQTYNAKICFAGKDGSIVLDICGALAEALNGKAAYDQAVSILQHAVENANGHEQAFNADALAQTLATQEDSPLYDAILLLKKWYAAGLIHRESFSLTKDMLAAFMQNDMASVVFMSLSDHRAFDRAVIEPFTSIYFPSDYPAATRNFTAPIIFAVPLTKTKQAQQILQNAIKAETQENLSRATGLAPVLAQCRTPDRQADDARYWVAATNAPLAGLSREVALSDEQLNALGVALGVLVRFGN